MTTDASTLSASETALYDRQIRLWGMSSQRALKEGSTLIVGLTPVSLEICKNLVLAGSNVTLVDSDDMEPFDNFMISLESIEDDHKMSFAERTAVALRRLNPMAKVSVVSSTQDKDSFNVAVVSVQKSDIESSVVPSLMTLDSHHPSGLKMMVTVESELAVWSLLQCDKHTVAEISKGEASLPALIHTDSILQILRTTQKPGNLRSKKREPAFAEEAFNWLSHKVQAHKQSTDPETIPSNMELPTPPSSRKRRRSPEIVRSPTKTISSTHQHSYASPALAAVAGGLIAQEVIKLITRKDIPLLNTITVDMDVCGAYVKQVGYSKVEYLGKPDDDVLIVSDKQGETSSAQVDLD